MKLYRVTLNHWLVDGHYTGAINYTNGYVMANDATEAESIFKMGIKSRMSVVMDRQLQIKSIELIADSAGKESPILFYCKPFTFDKERS